MTVAFNIKSSSLLISVKIITDNFDPTFFGINYRVVLKFNFVPPNIFDVSLNAVKIRSSSRSSSLSVLVRILPVIASELI